MARFNYTRALNRLVEWANNEGIKNIILDHNDISYIDFERKSLNYPKVIKIEGKYTKEIQVYLMLHELGHYQIRKDWEKFAKILPISYEAENTKFFDKDNRLLRRTTYIVSIIEEEYLAWEEGKKLGMIMDIKINDKNWYDLRSKSLMSYIRFYGKKK
jgi:hypothetical protein